MSGVGGYHYEWHRSASRGAGPSFGLEAAKPIKAARGSPVERAKSRVAATSGPERIPHMGIAGSDSDDHHRA
jgi:hypothetical protein